MSDAATTKRTLETNQVLSSGLVALSVNGNNITKAGIHKIVRALSNNHWFLGEDYWDWIHILIAVLGIYIDDIYCK